jgi:hypothetical protein
LVGAFFGGRRAGGGFVPPPPPPPPRRPSTLSRYRPKVVLADPSRDVSPQRCTVHTRRRIVHAAKHAGDDDFLDQVVRPVIHMRHSARYAARERHLQVPVAEETVQRLGNVTGEAGVCGRIFRMRRRAGEGCPGHISLGRWITVAVGAVDRRDRAPIVVVVLCVEARLNRVARSDEQQREKSCTFADVEILGCGECPQVACPERIRILGVEARDLGLLVGRREIETGRTEEVRCDNAMAPAVAADDSALYYVRYLDLYNGVLDAEIRKASPLHGESTVLATVSGTRVPVTPGQLVPTLSADGAALAMPLVDGETTNIWMLPTAGGPLRPLTDFGERSILIARRVAWSPDGRYVYASVAEVDSDIMLLDGLLR